MLKITRHPRAYLLIVIPALLLFFGLAVNTAVSKSITNDEPTHLLRGYALWTTGDLQYQGAHAPLSHWLIGGLLTTEPTLPDLQTLPEWGGDRVQLAREMLLENDANTNLQRVLFLGRTPVILLGMLLGAMVVQWARVLSGKNAAWMAAILFGLAPNWLGIAALATTDGPLTVTFFAAVWGLWGWEKRPSRSYWLLASITLGLALSTKVTALLLLPVAFALIYSQWSRQEPIWKPFLRWVSLLPIAFFVLWACYGFEWGPLPGMSVSLPAPTYAANFLTAQTHVEDSHLTFLLGERGRTGWWYYFIVAFLVKTPAVMLFLLVIGSFLIIWRREWQRTIYLWFPAGSLFLAASLTGLNIGYRHILPVLPFVWLIGTVGIQGKGAKGQGGKEEKENSLSPLRSLRWIILFALGWYIFAAFQQHPHHLAYFNEFVGGSANGYRYLSDSNIDWGQDLYLLAEYAAASDEPVHVSYNGFPDVSSNEGFLPLTMDAETGLINTFSAANPTPGRYAISVTHLHGTSLREPDIFDWFRRQTPVDQLGYSIFIYDVPTDMSGEWIGHCATLGPVLEASEAEALVNRSGLRNLYFDCTQSWIFPDNGSPGWYVVPAEVDFITPPVSLIPHSVLVHAPTTSAPAYELFYWSGDGNVAKEMAAWSGAVSLADGVELKRPFSINNTAQFLGYQQNNTTWLTAWQVENTPTAPLSMMAHLQGAETAVQVADDLGFSSDQWQPGDVIVQQYVFEGGETAVFLRTGLYNYVSGEQLPLANQPDTAFQLTPIN